MNPEQFTEEGHVFYKWKVGGSEFVAWPEGGARLMKWDVLCGSNKVRSVLYWPQKANYAQPEKIRGGNPILFPFVARTFAEGKENFWQLPSGEIRPMPRHGFARQGRFEIIRLDSNGFSAKLLTNSVDRSAYPFNYNFKVHYCFHELGLKVDLELENYDNQNIPWCAGHHFYFKIPWHSSLGFKDYRIEIPAKKAFRHLMDGKLERIKDFSQKCSLDDPKLIDCIHTQLKTNKVIFGPKNGEENIIITFDQTTISSEWLAVTTWTENLVDSPFYCIEPWMGPPNAPTHKKGLHTVMPANRDIFSIEVSLI